MCWIRSTEPALLLVLDGIHDPHNLGACLRVADAFGVHAVIAPKDRAVGLTATVHKVASGAADAVPYISVTNLARTLRELKQRGISVIGAAADAGQSILTPPVWMGPLRGYWGARGKACAGLRVIPVTDLFPFPCWAALKALMFPSVPGFACLKHAGSAQHVRSRLEIPEQVRSVRCIFAKPPMRVSSRSAHATQVIF